MTSSGSVRKSWEKTLLLQLLSLLLSFNDYFYYDIDYFVVFEKGSETQCYHLQCLGKQNINPHLRSSVSNYWISKFYRFHFFFFQFVVTYLSKVELRPVCISTEKNNQGWLRLSKLYFSDGLVWKHNWSENWVIWIHETKAFISFIFNFTRKISFSR